MKKEGFYNTIIVGAGPGGLIAGQYLKDALILEQKKEIGKPVRCGEGLSISALKEFEINPDPSWICCYIKTVQRIMPNGKIVGKTREELSCILDRVGFEKSLAKKCQAEIQLNTKVIDLRFKNGLWEVKTNKGLFRSKYLIGADGCLSIVRRKIFKEKLEIIPAIQYLVKLERKLDTSVIKIYLDNQKFKDGYAWIFPKSNNTANIGIGAKGNLQKMFKKFMEETVKKEYGVYKLLENKSGIVPSGKTLTRLEKNNALLAGEAGGLIDPFFKGGMRQAMLSGRIAAQCILNNYIDSYDKKIRSYSFVDSKVVEASKDFYSFDNQILNELGEILENKSTSYLKTPAGILKTISHPYLRKNFFKIYRFILIWRKNKSHLW